MEKLKMLNELQLYLEKNIKKYDVPGASMAVLYDGVVYTAAAGVLNINTGVNVTKDSIFQIGSISKIFTATLIMQLVDEGKLALDTPVKKYLPTFQVADMEATQKITVRQLLSHISGMDGDFFVEADYGRDKLARYMEKCALLPQLHPPGEYLSYCNSGFCIAGRLIEVATGQTWEEVMCERIFEPLGMDHAVVRAEDTLKFRTAVGHLPLPEKDQTENKKQMVTPIPYLQSSLAPAGATATMTASDLLKFVQLHLCKGSMVDGKLVLTEKSIKEMQKAQFTVTKYCPENLVAMGLGWMLSDWGGKRVIGHDGVSMGEFAFLRIVPEQEIVVALLTNGLNGEKLYRTMFSMLLEELAGIQIPLGPEPVEMSLDFDQYIGLYENISTRMEFFVADGILKGRAGDKMWSEAVVPPQEFNLLSIEKDHFLVKSQGNMPSAVISFLGKTDTGRAQYVMSGGRMKKRIG